MTNTTLPYDVVYCSSQDPCHSIDNLLGRAPSRGEKHRAAASIKGGGWQSEKDGKTAHMLVLRFTGNVWLQQLKIVMHASKIASRVELSVFRLQGENLVEPPSFRSARFLKLGAVDFNSNGHANPRAKERKTIHIKTEAYFLRLLLDRTLTSNRNRYNQVGIYSIECVGRLLTPIPSHSDAVVQHVSIDMSSHGMPLSGAQSPRACSGNSHHPIASTLSSTGNTSRARRGSSSASTSRKRSLSRNAAYSKDTADSLRTHPNPLLLLPSEVQSFRSVRIMEFEEFFLRRSEELLSLKEQAAALDDLDTARRCRDKLLELNKVSKTVYRLEQSKVQAIIEEDFSHAQKTKERMDRVVEAAYKTFDMAALQCNDDIREISSSSIKDDESSNENYEVTEARATPNEVLRSRKLSAQMGSESVPGDGELVGRMDMHDAPIVTSIPTDESVINVPERSAALHKDDPEESSKILEEAIHSFTGEGDIDAISLVDATVDTRSLRKVLGSYMTACLVSRRFKLREGALMVVTEHISTTLRSSVVSVVDAVLRFLDFNSFGLQDPIPNVVFAACNFVRKSLSDECHCIHRYLLSLLNLLPRLLSRASETASRVRCEAMMTLQLYIQTEKVPSTAILHAILADPVDREKRKVPFSSPRPQLARLNLLQHLLDAGRLTLDAASGMNLTRKLLLPAVNHQSPEVRDTATTLYALLVSLRVLSVKGKDLGCIINTGIRQAIQAASKS